MFLPYCNARSLLPRTRNGARPRSRRKGKPRSQGTGAGSVKDGSEAQAFSRFFASLEANQMGRKVRTVQAAAMRKRLLPAAYPSMP